ncbi:MAG: hypothetical protein IJ566_05790 [Cardiobacteriaceae bacterium]|nr:hypothetical protein [Cardiobacteriaceae bacterium]
MKKICLVMAVNLVLTLSSFAELQTADHGDFSEYLSLSEESGNAWSNELQVQSNNAILPQNNAPTVQKNANNLPVSSVQIQTEELGKNVSGVQVNNNFASSAAITNQVQNTLNNTAQTGQNNLTVNPQINSPIGQNNLANGGNNLTLGNIANNPDGNAISYNEYMANNDKQSDKKSKKSGKNNKNGAKNNEEQTLDAAKQLQCKQLTDDIWHIYAYTASCIDVNNAEYSHIKTGMGEEKIKNQLASCYPNGTNNQEFVRTGESHIAYAYLIGDKKSVEAYCNKYRAHNEMLLKKYF